MDCGRRGSRGAGTAFLSAVLLAALSGCPALQGIEYQLRLRIEGRGTLTSVPDSDMHLVGTTVALTASPGDGWRFDRWADDLSGTKPSATITMDGDRTVTAVFERRTEYALAVDWIGNGTVAISPERDSYEAGHEVTLTPIPDVGWRFDQWEGDLGGNDDPAEITMAADLQVTAVFVVTDRYSLSIVATQGEGVVSLLPPGGTYDSGTIVALTAHPAAGWRFDRWGEDLSSVANPARVTMNSSLDVVAVFVPD